MTGDLVTRPKLLLLLAYLTLEGTQNRRQLALLFWGSTQNPMVSLRLALSELRKTPGLIETNRHTVSSPLVSDVVNFEKFCRQAQWEDALALYKGPFLDNLNLSLEGDLETWLIETRERLAQTVVNILLEQAELALRDGQQTLAMQKAERAYTLKAAPLLYGQNLTRLQQLLGKLNSPLLEKLELEHPHELFTDEPGTEAAKPGRRHENPYRGLLAFRESDAAFFFGRDRETQELMERLSHPPYSLCIVGNSGAGKSSLVFAGLLPKLRQQDWQIATLRPGRHPLSALTLSLLELDSEKVEHDLTDLAQDLAHQVSQENLGLGDLLERLNLKDKKVVLFVDQLEELFLNEGETVQKFIEILLVRKPDPQLVTLFTLRADYLSTLLSYSSSLPIMREAQYLLGPIEGEGLEEVILEPARRQLASFEAGLKERILADLAGQKNSLPLLAFTLMQLWDRQLGDVLSHDTYSAIGGIAQALVRHAEESFAKLSPNEQKGAELVFTQLVNPGQGQADSKRVAYAYELKDYWSTVIHKLASSPERLLVIGHDERGETVELIHEALIENWDRLKTWINTYRSFRSWQERFRQYLRLWQRQQQPDDLLLQGYLLDEAERYFEEKPDFLAEQEKSYISQSRKLRESRLEQEEKQRQEKLLALEQLAEHEKSLRLADNSRISAQRRYIRWLAAVGFLAIFFSVFAFSARNTALHSNRRLVEQREQNQNLLAELLGEKAAVNQLNSPEQSLLLALEANSRASTSRTRRITEAILRQVVADTAGVRLAHTDRVLAASFDPSGNYFITAGRENALYVWQLEAVLTVSEPKPVKRIDLSDGNISSLNFSPEGHWLVSTSYSGEVNLWDSRQLPELKHVQTLSEHPEAVLAATFIDNENLLTACRDHLVRRWHFETDWQLEASSKDLGGPVQALSLSADGSYLAAGTNTENAQVFLWTGSNIEDTAQTLPIGEGIRSLALNQDGSYLAVGDQAGRIHLYQPEQLTQAVAVLEAHNDLVVGLAFSSETHWLASSSRDKTVKLWFLQDLAQGLSPRNLSLHGHEDKLAEGLVFSPDGHFLLSTGWDNAARLVDMTYPGPDLNFLPLSSPARSIDLNPDGTQLVLGNLAGEVQVLDAHHLSSPGQTLGSHDSWVEHVAFAPDGKELISTGDASKGQARSLLLWNIEANEPEARVLKAKQGTVFSAVISPTGVIASAGENKTIEVWQGVEPAPERVLGPFDDIVTDIAFQAGGKFFASTGFDNTLRIFTLADGFAEKPIDLAEPLRAVAFSLDGKYLAAASWQGGAFLQDLTALDKPALKIPSESSSSYAVAFSADSRWLAFGNDDGSISLSPTEHPLDTLNLRGHRDIVWSLSFSPDNQWLISASADGTLRYWYIAFEKVKELACQKAGRNLTTVEWQKVFGEESYQANCPFTSPLAVQ